VFWGWPESWLRFYILGLNTTTSIVAGWRGAVGAERNYSCFGEDELGGWRRFLLDRRGLMGNFCGDRLPAQWQQQNCGRRPHPLGAACHERLLKITSGLPVTRQRIGSGAKEPFNFRESGLTGMNSQIRPVAAFCWPARVRNSPCLPRTIDVSLGYRGHKHE